MLGHSIIKTRCSIVLQGRVIGSSEKLITVEAPLMGDARPRPQAFDLLGEQVRRARFTLALIRALGAPRGESSGYKPIKPLRGARHVFILPEDPRLCC